MGPGGKLAMLYLYPMGSSFC